MPEDKEALLCAEVLRTTTAIQAAIYEIMDGTTPTARKALAQCFHHLERHVSLLMSRQYGG